jgi:predicted DNA-binding antitoxin AbrB/MazE fold protein
MVLIVISSSQEDVMRETIDAIYENGVLRPLHKLSMHEGQRVRLSMESKSGDEASTKAVYDFSDLAGCLRSSPRFSADPVATQRELRDEWR